MDIASGRTALDAEPSVPFAIRLADGRSLPVPHPDFVALTPRRVIVGATDDTWSVLEPLLIVSLDHRAGRRPDGIDPGGQGRRAG
jgi:hypothetical protein